jgi:hypothetical protein
MQEEDTLRTLPIEGAALREFVVEGSGKDTEVSAVMADGRRFRFEARDAQLEVTVRGTVLTEIQGPDDMTLRFRYTAKRLVLKRAQVLYPGSEEDWQEDMKRQGGGQSLSWTIRVANFELVGDKVKA